ncbi:MULTISPECIES: hypothetical protein [Thalassospira]|uniref:hypothetical protein n=1 Tax=Thalassospira TaxID=168934 RepID=UPI0008DDADD5|nr:MULTISPECIES: hypothetical protein [Thalassospira]MDM7975212.1 hypothetical protein [Thalassospira xiamenensis]OHZ01003.1 hypothetical protein BC440_09200 [Thalassospira sp. MIT1004]
MMSRYPIAYSPRVLHLPGDFGGCILMPAIFGPVLDFSARPDFAHVATVTVRSTGVRILLLRRVGGW